MGVQTLEEGRRDASPILGCVAKTPELEFESPGAKEGDWAEWLLGRRELETLDSGRSGEKVNFSSSKIGRWGWRRSRLKTVYIAGARYRSGRDFFRIWDLRDFRNDEKSRDEDF